MRTRARTCLLATVLCIAPAGCGQSDGAPQAGRAPVSAPNITLSGEDRKAWPPGPARRTGIPALVYRDVDAKTFARQMALLSHAGYRTVTLETFVRFVQGR